MKDSKASLRDEMRKRRADMSDSERAVSDAAICDRVCTLPRFREAEVVFAYLSFGSEVDTRGVIDRAWAAGKTVALPRCASSRRMRWFYVEDYEGLEKSSFGPLEPLVDEGRELHPADCANAIALVPGLAFDESGFRLGYGGGYYDAFLSDFPGFSVGLCRRSQLVANLADYGAVLAFDRPVDVVVSDLPVRLAARPA